MCLKKPQSYKGHDRENQFEARISPLKELCAYVFKKTIKSQSYAPISALIP